MSIIREIEVTRKGLDTIIDVTYGTELLPIELKITDYQIPSGATAVVYEGKSSKDPKKLLCNIKNNTIIFTPVAGFFEVGKNDLQVRVVYDNKSLFSFKCKVNCHESYRDDDAKEVESQPTLVEQILSKMNNGETGATVEQIAQIEKNKQDITKLSETKIDNPTSAKVGQILSVVEVDENGKPTKWQPVDKPSGGTGSADGCIKVYNNVASMKADTNLKVGDVVETVGYYNIFDVGGGRYTVASSPTNNEILNIKLDNGLYAILGLENNTYYMSRLGLGYGQKSIAEVFPLISDNTITIINNGWGTSFTKESSADAFAIQYIVNIFGAKGEIVLDGVNYYIDNTLKLKSLLTIRGLEKNVNIYSGQSTYTGSNLIMTVDKDMFTTVDNCVFLRLLDFNATSQVNMPTSTFFKPVTVSYLHMRGVYVSNFEYGVYKQNGFWWNTIEKCRFNWIIKNGIDLRMRSNTPVGNVANESIIRDCIFNLGESLYHRDDIPDTQPTPDFGNCIVIEGNGVHVDHCDLTSAKIGVYLHNYYDGCNITKNYSEGIWIKPVYVDSYRCSRIVYDRGFSSSYGISYNGYDKEYLIDYTKEVKNSDLVYYRNEALLFMDLFKTGIPFKIKYRIQESNKISNCGFSINLCKKNNRNDIETIYNYNDDTGTLKVEPFNTSSGYTYGVHSISLEDSTTNKYKVVMSDDDKSLFIKSFEMFKYNYLCLESWSNVIESYTENEDGSLSLILTNPINVYINARYTVLQSNYAKELVAFRMWFTGNPEGSTKYWKSELIDGYYYITVLIHPYDLIMPSFDRENFLAVFMLKKESELISVEYADEYPCTSFAVGYEESTLIKIVGNDTKGELIITKDLGDSYFTFNNTKFIITGGKAYTEDGFEAVNKIPTKPIPFARYYDITNKQKVVVGADGTTTVYS